MTDRAAPADMPRTCSFCYKTEHEAWLLVSGMPGTFICDECIGLCNDIIADRRAAEGNATLARMLDKVDALLQKALDE